MSASTPLPDGSSRFDTTSWTLVFDAAGEQGDRSRQALAVLLDRYWFPLYAYLRRKGQEAADAQDMTQAFFARLLEKDTIAAADRDRGRFRTFLLTCFDNFCRNEWEKARAEKRGGGAAPVALDFGAAESRYSLEPSHEATPEREFERRWALTVLDRAMARLRAEFAADGREEDFDLLRPYLTGELARGAAAEIAGAMRRSPGAVKVAIHRLRKRYGEALRAEVAETVLAGEDVDDEVESLLRALQPD